MLWSACAQLRQFSIGLYGWVKVITAEHTTKSICFSCSFSFFTLFSLTSSLWPFQSGKIILKIFFHVFCIKYHHQQWFPAFSAAATQLTRSIFRFSFTSLRGRLVQLEMKLLHFFPFLIRNEWQFSFNGNQTQDLFFAHFHSFVCLIAFTPGSLCTAGTRPSWKSRLKLL